MEEDNHDMAIRLRTIDGTRIALCAYETDPKPGDVYLDDAEHYALAAKFSQDFGLDVKYKEHEIMETQKVRDAKTRWSDDSEEK